VGETAEIDENFRKYVESRTDLIIDGEDLRLNFYKYDNPDFWKRGCEVSFCKCTHDVKFM